MTIYHVSFGFSGKQIAIEDVQKVLAGDGWARYAPNCWIVETNESAQLLTMRLRALCQSTDSLFICELNLKNNFGYLHQEIWDWINARTR